MVEAVKGGFPKREIAETARRAGRGGRDLQALQDVWGGYTETPVF